VLIAFSALFFAAGQKVDLENLAKGDENTSRREDIDGKYFTALSVGDIRELLDNQTGGSSPFPSPSHRIMWLGNSQLHYINQYRQGDHLSPYWLRALWRGSTSIAILGCSLPNVNLQEFLIISRYSAIRSPVQLLIIELCFNNLRDDELRGDFAEMLSPKTASQLQLTSGTADAIVSRFLLARKEGGETGATSVLSGTIQEPVEKWLDSHLAAASDLWASRPRIEGMLMGGLYSLRNYVFGIRATTVRKMIKDRYIRNMEALHDILQDSAQRGLPVLLYIAPIRQDRPMPYDGAEYAKWKAEAEEMAEHFGTQLVNLEHLVPGDMWGTYKTSTDVDFMHFQGPGHKLVAEALLPHAEKILEKRPN